jgi:hypothetical protein
LTVGFDVEGEVVLGGLGRVFVGGSDIFFGAQICGVERLTQFTHRLIPDDDIPRRTCDLSCDPQQNTCLICARALPETQIQIEPKLFLKTPQKLLQTSQNLRT